MTGEDGGGAEPLELEVESIAVGGDGVAREPGGRVVFVPRTAPGDRVRARLVDERSSYARARPERILSPGPGRRDAPCPYYGGCGGCQLQHMEPGAQRDAKREAVRDALERIGGRTAEVPTAIAAGEPFGYRNRITLTLRRRRDRGVIAGYHRWDDPGRLIDVEHCPLAESAVDRAWRVLRGDWGEGAERLPSGDELRITVRASAAGEVVLVIEGGDAPGEPRAVAEALPDLSGYFWRPRDGERRRLAGEPRLRESWQGFELELGPDTFVQVNRAVADAMEAHLDRKLAERLGGPAGRRVLDLYAGVGVRALRWALAGADAAACEADDEAVDAGRAAAGRHGADVEFHAARVEERLATLLPADLVVVNPPRAGLSRAVAERLGAASASALAYVSCDPATLARDLERLGEQWRILSVQPFDAFPQTAHVETIVWLEETGGDGRSAPA